MLRSLYDWTISLAHHPAALWILFIVAFAESSFFPIPPDVLMIPMIIARPSRAFLIAGVCLLGSVLGGIAGSGRGSYAFESLAKPMLDTLRQAHHFVEFAETNYT